MIQWLRRGELILFVLGSMPLIVWGVQSVSRRQYWTFASIVESLEYTAMFWIPGLVVMVLDRKLVKWIVPISKLMCPQCGQSLIHLAEPRCPECGCPIPESLVDRTSNRTGE